MAIILGIRICPRKKENYVGHATQVLESCALGAGALDFRIIHIAAHGIASDRFPDRAALGIRTIPLTTETTRRRV
jgi:hypothetical protein